MLALEIFEKLARHGKPRISLSVDSDMHAKIPHPSEVHRFHPFLNNAGKEHRCVRERFLIAPARGKALASRLTAINPRFVNLSGYVLYM